MELMEFIDHTIFKTGVATEDVKKTQKPTVLVQVPVWHLRSNRSKEGT